MKGRNPTAAEKRHMARVAEIGCIICLQEGYNTPAGIHHVEGKTKSGAHFKVLPLCFLHHQGGKCSNRYISVHPYKAQFEARYGTQQELLEWVDKFLKAREVTH